MNKELLRKIPSVDELMLLSNEYVNSNKEKDLPKKVNPSLLLRITREYLSILRNEILSDKIDRLPTEDEMVIELLRLCNEQAKNKLRPLINGSGITLHTNFGRAPLSNEAAFNVYNIATHYSNLEYDVENGSRGTRYSCIEEYITRITNTESALVVNNNAAALMLVLHALGYGKNMIISRGELVEIGGSFRVPAIMEISGVKLKEIGCTNKTHKEDYINAIDENTAAILKVHSSNFVMKGFTEEVDVKSLKKISEEKNIPLIHDVGSTDLKDISFDADIISFSADKLLGGPQAGIVCGKKKYIDIIKKDDLLRTVRIDKLSLAALEVTLRMYDEGQQDLLPTNAMLNMPMEIMERKCNLLRDRLSIYGNVKTDKIITNSLTGGGSRPGEELTDIGVKISIDGYTPDGLSKALRLNEAIPIIGRIHEDNYIISMRTVSEEEFDDIVLAIGML